MGIVTNTFLHLSITQGTVCIMCDISEATKMVSLREYHTVIFECCVAKMK